MENEVKVINNLQKFHVNIISLSKVVVFSHLC